MMTRRESFALGALYMTLSGSMLALIGFMAKLGAHDFPISSLIFYRFTLAAVIGALGCLFIGRVRDAFRFKNLPIQSLRTLFVLIAQYSFFYYAAHNTLLNATVLLNTGPIFIPIIEWAILRKHVGKSTWIAVAVSFMGVLLVLRPDQGIFSWLSLIGLMAGLGQGASQTIFGLTAREEHPYLGVVHMMWLCSAVSLVPYLLFGLGHDSYHREIDLWVILGLGVTSLVNQFTRVAAYAHGSPSRLAVFLYFGVLVAALLDIAVYHTIPDTLSLIGAALVVLGGVLKVILRAWILSKKK